MRIKLLHILFVVVGLLCAASAVAQKMPERGLVRKGNRQFAKQLYEQSSDSYGKALLHDSTSFEARYNMANSLIRRAMADSTAYQDPQSANAKLSSGFLSQAEGLLQQAATDSLRTKADRAEAYFNMGNAQVMQQKLQEALQSYRRSLVLNPNDMEAKYNYAYVKKLLEQNQDQNQNQNDQNQDNQDNQNNQNNQNQNNQNQNNQDNKNDNQNNNQDQNQDKQNDQNNQNQGGGQDEKEQPNQNQPKPRSGMSDKQQQQLLDAIQAQEDKTQDKLDEKAKGVIVKGKKNW